MLTHPTMEKLEALRLSGMAKAFAEQRETAEIDSLGFEERLGLLVDRELTERENRRLASRLDSAHEARHAVMDCLVEAMWQSQRGGAPLESGGYLECVLRKAAG